MNNDLKQIRHETFIQRLPRPYGKGLQTLQYPSCTKPRLPASILPGFFEPSINQTVAVMMHIRHLPARDMSQPGEKLNRVSTR